MAYRSSKRFSDDILLDTKKKKKKISNEKCNLIKDDVTEEKTAIVCDGHSRQKKAFFAYFGKTLDDGKKSSAKSNNNDTNEAKLMNKKLNTLINDSEVQMEIDKNKKKLNRKKSIEFNFNKDCFMKENTNLPYVSSFFEELGYFPKISHTNWLAPFKKSDLMLSLNEEMLYNDGIKNSTILFQSSSSKTERLVLEPHHMEINLPYMITCLKKSTPNFPVSHFHKYMKKKCLLAKQSTTNIEPLWIDKYKPMCEEEVLGNSELVKRLKKWLKPIKEKSKQCKTYDSDDNYVFASDGDSDSNSKVQVHHNLAILLGPSGCGKTSAVYAVANELNANVIELNASCNRNGKRIITDLMEATQSHAVEKNCLFNMIKEKSKKHKNLKGKKEMNEKMTIILIEDADILFENHDDGYLSAISTLATDSKRPFILTANDSFSNNLLKFFVSSKMVLNFVYPPKQHLNCFLQLMALNEGVIMSEDEIKTFIHPLKPDVRQSTLQLQYILNTGEIANRTLNNTYIRCINSAWWNWPYVLGYDSINIENDKQAKCNINMATICENLDVLSKLNLINAKTQSCNFLDPQPFWHHIAIRDSSSLIETNHWSDNTVQLSTDIFDWIYNHINTRDYNCDKLYPTPEDLSHRQRMWNISNDLVEQIGLDFCNRKNETCFDYMATIRSLSKNQQVNQPFSNLRQSKMFSYLRRINIEVDSNELKHFCDSFQSNSNCYQPVNQSDQL